MINCKDAHVHMHTHVYAMSHTPSRMETPKLWLVVAKPSTNEHASSSNLQDVIEFIMRFAILDIYMPARW